MKGEMTGLSLNYQTRQPEITLTVDGDIEQLEKLKGQTLSVELKRFRRRRSLEANAYFYVLITKIAEAVGQSVNYIHNDMLRKYGQIEIIDGQAIYVVLPDTEAVYGQINESEGYHLRPTSQVQPGRGGLMYRTFLMLRGSHDYDSKEMSVLIDGVISEARELGIDTITEREKQEMMERYGIKHYSERHE